MSTYLTYAAETVLQLRLVDLVAYGDDEAAVDNLAAAQLICIGQIVYGNHAIGLLRGTDTHAWLQRIAAHALRPGIGLVATRAEGDALTIKRKVAMVEHTLVPGVTALILLQHIPANGLTLSGNQKDAKPAWLSPSLTCRAGNVSRKLRHWLVRDRQHSPRLWNCSSHPGTPRGSFVHFCGAKGEKQK